MNEMIPGCEQYEHYCEMRAAMNQNQYFHVGDKSNKKEFEYLTHIIDIHSVGGCYNTHEHPSLNYGLGKGEKLKYLGMKIAYMTFRFETDKGDVVPSDVIGNVFVHTIKKRFIINDYASLTSTMWEQTFYIDKFGNKWRLINANGDVELIEIAPEDFWLWDYLNKDSVEYINDFSYKDYEFWKREEGQLKALY